MHGGRLWFSDEPDRLRFKADLPDADTARHRLGFPPQSSEMADSIAAPMNAYQPRRGEDPEGVDGGA